MLYLLQYLTINYKTMLLELIATLGISIIFSENAKVECGLDHKVQGCYIPWSNTIVLDYNSWNLDRTMYHEIGHAIIEEDDELIMTYYSPLLLRTSYEKPLVEHWCDYYASYKLNPSFSVEYPSLFIYFRDKENKALNKITRTEYYHLVI